MHVGSAIQASTGGCPTHASLRPPLQSISFPNCSELRVGSHRFSSSGSMFGFLWGRGRKGGRRGAGEDEHKLSPFDRQTILETEKFPLPGPRPPFQTTAYDHDDRAVYDYVKQMTVENVWYYR